MLIYESLNFYARHDVKILFPTFFSFTTGFNTEHESVNLNTVNNIRTSMAVLCRNKSHVKIP